ncbi:MAG: hypothetical protein NWR99_08690, partial [Verrucomicrobiales bacterium]|nr:hypothetical protein [Verrucomicrobiales bacterium]
PGTVRSDSHRWVHDNKQEMLFDLRSDPGEKNNLAAQQPEIAATLSKAYDAWFASDGHRFIMMGKGPNVLGVGIAGNHWTMMTGRKN